MADKETFQKEMRAKLKQWSRIIDELRAEGEDKDKPITPSQDFNSFRKKGIIIYDNYLEARRKFEELANTDDATWARQASEIENIMKRLDHLWETLFSKQ
jgi:sigma54-dependent transcription regulator